MKLLCENGFMGGIPHLKFKLLISNCIFFSLFPKTELFYLSHKLVDLYPGNPVSKTIFFLPELLRKYFANV